MNIQIRPYAPADYPMLATWWKGHGWEAVSEAVLPALGVVAYHSDKESQHEDYPLCAGWLYMDNSRGVCWLEWLVSNPEANGKHVFQAITTLVDFMSQEALRMDYGVMMTSCRQESLVRIYESTGFNVTDRNVTHLVKILRS